ncbi:MAG: addiction module protein [Verrucomicrobiota bacterium]
MKAVLDFGHMSKLEKVQAMEALWNDLSDHEEELESPDWHATVLEQREKDLQEGKDEFIPLEKAQEVLRSRQVE